MKKVFWFILSLFLYGIAGSALIILGLIYLAMTVFIPVCYMQWYIRIACRLILLCAGQWLIIKGRPPQLAKGPYLYLINHESILDIFMMGAAIPENFGIIVADYNFKIPGWRWIAKRYGAISVKRDKLEEAKVSLSRLEKEISAGKSVVIFPEGSRTFTGQLQEFKKGAFHVAKNTGIKLVPCGIEGAFEHQNRTRFCLKPGVLIWSWGKAIPYYSGYQGLTVSQIRDLIKDMIEFLIVNSGGKT